MSLDNLLVDRHRIWQDLCRKEARLQHASATQEHGASGLERLSAGEPRMERQVKRVMLQRSLTTSRLLDPAGERQEHGSPISGMSPSAADGQRSRSIVREQHKQQKVQDALKQQLAREAPMLQEEIRCAAQERRRLMTEVKLARSVQPIKKAPSLVYFKTDPTWEQRPMLPNAEKRTVLQACRTATGVMSFVMG